VPPDKGRPADETDRSIGACYEVAQLFDVDARFARDRADIFTGLDQFSSGIKNFQPVCGELLIFHRNQQFATHTLSVTSQVIMVSPSPTFRLDRRVVPNTRNPA